MQTRQLSPSNAGVAQTVQVEHSIDKKKDEERSHRHGTLTGGTPFDVFPSSTASGPLKYSGSINIHVRSLIGRKVKGGPAGSMLPWTEISRAWRKGG